MVFDQNVMLMVAPLLLLLAGLAFTVMIDPYLQKIHRTILLVIAGNSAGALVFDRLLHFSGVKK